MSKKVVIIDYQLGNLFSVQQACAYLGHPAVISAKPEDLLQSDYAILPGVGAFGDAMENLNSLGLSGAIREYVAKGKPLMGVCLGLQLLLTESDEFGSTKGLNLLPGIVKKFPVQILNGAILKVPQIQWNTIRESAEGKWQHTPLQSCKPGDFMYFVHSYYAVPANEQSVLTTTTYGTQEYCSAIIRENIFATQFHPEKSGLYGVDIYKEWFSLF